jgi:hypothetical protein
MKEHDYAKLIGEKVNAPVIGGSYSIGQLVKADFDFVHLSPYLLYDDITERYFEMNNPEKPQIIPTQNVLKMYAILEQVYTSLKEFKKEKTENKK